MNFNYQAQNKTTGEVCGHYHHDMKTATACADHLGWAPDNFTVIRVNQNDFSSRSRHPNRAAASAMQQLEVNEYFVNLCVTVKADSELMAAQAVEKWVATFSRAKIYTGHTIESIERVGE